MFLVVGLGNPGREYENTRHNLGFRIAEESATRLGIKTFKEKHRSFVGDGEIGGRKVIIAEPQTFMNLSGEAVKEILSWYKIPPDHLIVAYDDLDLELGELRIRGKGSAGGHKGLESVIAHVGESDFIRVRIGIGRPSYEIDPSAYVLQNIPPSERPILDKAVINAADAIYSIITDGLDPAMNKFNGMRA